MHVLPPEIVFKQHSKHLKPFLTVVFNGLNRLGKLNFFHKAPIASGVFPPAEEFQEKKFFCSVHIGFLQRATFKKSKRGKYTGKYKVNKQHNVTEH